MNRQKLVAVMGLLLLAMGMMQGCGNKASNPKGSRPSTQAQALATQASPSDPAAIPQQPSGGEAVPTPGPISLLAAPGKCFDVQAASQVNGTPVQIYDCNGTDAQKWSHQDGTLQVYAGKCLDVTDGVDANGTRLQIWDCAPNSPNQQWRIVGNTLVWGERNKCIDLPNGDQSNGTVLQIVGCEANNPNQQWNIGGNGGGNSSTTGGGNNNTSGNENGGSNGGSTSDVDFGPNVHIFHDRMDMKAIQATLNNHFGVQGDEDEFAKHRYAYLFKPGRYELDVNLGYYMTAQGLGDSPDDVVITGAVRSKGWFRGGNATKNFWRGAENMAVIPVPSIDNGKNMWAVSQATWLRRFHVMGNIALSEEIGDEPWSSGGFIADSLVDGEVNAGTQQQFLFRNSSFSSLRDRGGSWNFVFVGNKMGHKSAPDGEWPHRPITAVADTPVVREKPYLIIDNAGKYSVVVPPLKAKSKGVSWEGGRAAGSKVLPISDFHIAIAKEGEDHAASLNAALAAGKHLLITPGFYKITAPLIVSKPDTVILGMGLATLFTESNRSAIEVADVDGVTIAGVMLDAGLQNAPTMLRLGNAASRVSHASNPTVLHDVFCRVGGPQAAKAESCVILDSNDVIMDNIWLWRADHHYPIAGWNENPSKTGIIVNGENVTAYGLFVEHFQGYQTEWNANGGRVYLYQSELPYDVPNQEAWKDGNEDGFASYKVGASVTRHEAKGLGVYAVFDHVVHLENAIKTPSGDGIDMQNMVILTLGWKPESTGCSIRHVINGMGRAVKKGEGQMFSRCRTKSGECD